MRLDKLFLEMDLGFFGEMQLLVQKVLQSWLEIKIFFS